MSTSPDEIFLPRTLTYEDNGEEKRIGHEELDQLTGNLVILGEPGAGKSELLKHLTKDRNEFLRARSLIAAGDPAKLLAGSSRVIIDALDEVPSTNESGAIDRLLQRLHKLTIDQFILSCRSGEWAAATNRQLIEDVFGSRPTVLRLLPLNNEEIWSFLCQVLGNEKAEIAWAKLTAPPGTMSDMLGNPQTLKMIAAIAATGILPRSIPDLFENYAEVCWMESNPVKLEAQTRPLSLEAGLDGLGAAFGALILTGKEALAKHADPADQALLDLAEIDRLAGAAHWDQLANSRLVSTWVEESGQRYTYGHRRLGEWLGARWLARQIREPRHRERLVRRLTHEGIVPANLRGIFGWLAINTQFRAQIIDIDPLAIFEAGAADAFNPPQGRRLLAALRSLAEVEPWLNPFGGQANILGHPDLQPDVRAIISDDTANLHLRILLLRQLAGADLGTDTRSLLQTLLEDQDEVYGLRYQAVGVLASVLDVADWVSYCPTLRQSPAMHDRRLAENILQQVGLAHFDDQDIVETVFAAAGFGETELSQPAEDFSWAGYSLRNAIPDDRLESILSLAADRACERLPRLRGTEHSGIIGFGKALIARRLNLDPAPESTHLHKWLKGFGGRDSYTKADEDTITSFLNTNPSMRQAIQRQVLLPIDDPEALRMAAITLNDLYPAILIQEEDLVALLNALATDDERWRTLVQLWPHGEHQGVLVRQAAERFSKHHDEDALFLHDLVNGPKPAWQVENENRNARWEAERERKLIEFRDSLKSNRQAIEKAEPRALIPCAKIYFGCWTDLNPALQKIEDPADRLRHIAGEELTKIALTSFDTHLGKALDPPLEKIAEDHVDDRYGTVPYVLLAGLSERLRRSGTLGTLSVDQRLAARLHILNHALDCTQWDDLCKAIREDVGKNETLFRRFTDLAITPKLSLPLKNEGYVAGLDDVIGDDAVPRRIRADLARQWLTDHPDLHGQTLRHLINFLMAEETGQQQLMALAEMRLATPPDHDQARRAWQATKIVTGFLGGPDDFSPAYDRPDRLLLWPIRERLGSTGRPITRPERQIRLSQWIVSNFRADWPVADHPSDTSHGDQHPWNAAQFLADQINLIASFSEIDAADTALKHLRETPDEYRSTILNARAEWRTNRANGRFAGIPFHDLIALLTDGPPTTHQELQDRVLWVLDKVQRRISGDDTNSWRGFFSGEDKPKREEHCRDHLINLMRIDENAHPLLPESHVPNQRRTDIDCRLNNLKMPIEIKGQWHRNLWTAMNDQLAAQQAIDHLADGYGIYLVLWFGPGVIAKKQLKPPPKGVPVPETPQDLEQALLSQLNPAHVQKIKIKVLDLSRR